MLFYSPLAYHSAPRYERRMAKNAAGKRLPTVANAATPLERLVLQWRKAEEALELAKVTERALRDKLAAQFTNPEEGSNVREFGRLRLTLTHKINRKLDEALVDEVLAKLPKQWRTEGKLVAYKPSLVVSAYRELAEDPKLVAVFAACLTETCGAPTVEASFAPL